MFILSINNTIFAEIFEDYFEMCAVDFDSFSIVYLLNITLVLCNTKRENYSSGFS